MILDTGDWVSGTGYESERSRDPAGRGIAGYRLQVSDH